MQALRRMVSWAIRPTPLWGFSLAGGATVMYTIASASLSEGSDPITAFATHDWAAAGGWSLFILLALTIVLGSFKETWVPGVRFRRTEDALKKMTDAHDELLRQNGQLITQNEITKHFFEETVPKRGEGTP